MRDQSTLGKPPGGLSRAPAAFPEQPLGLAQQVAEQVGGDPEHLCPGRRERFDAEVLFPLRHEEGARDTLAGTVGGKAGFAVESRLATVLDLK